MGHFTKKAVFIIYYMMVHFSVICQTNTDTADTRKWIFVGNGNGGIPYYIQSKCLEKKDGIVTIMTKSIQPIFKKSGKVYKDVEVEIMYGVDCKNKLMITLTGMVSTKDDILVYKAYTEKEQKWETNAKNSIGEVILEAVCQRF
mgnify:CR=1 FL=1